MQAAPKPSNEAARIKALNKYQLLDTISEEVYDDITRIASEICGTPVALLSLVDEKRQWNKSVKGTKLKEFDRAHSFCAHAILQPDEIFIVPDARYDERFHDNPLTTGAPNIVFYAGVPVKDAEGHAFGSLCVIDNRPREIGEQKLESLKALAKLVSVNFDLRKTKLELEESRNELQAAQPAADTIREEVQALKQAGEHHQYQQFKALEEAADRLKQIFSKDDPA